MKQRHIQSSHKKLHTSTESLKLQHFLILPPFVPFLSALFRNQHYLWVLTTATFNVFILLEIILPNGKSVCVSASFLSYSFNQTSMDITDVFLHCIMFALTQKSHFLLCWWAWSFFSFWKIKKIKNSLQFYIAFHQWKRKKFFSKL